MWTNVPAKLNRHCVGENIIVVGGAPRSGTTLTQLILGAHPEIYAGPELEIFHGIVCAARGLNAAVCDGRMAGLSQPLVASAIGVMVEALVRPVLNLSNRKYFAEKTPSNSTLFVPLIELLPAAKFIHVVRDPVDVLSSMLAVGRRYRARGLECPAIVSDLKSSVDVLLEYVLAGYQASLERPDRVFTLRYEDLVNDPLTQTGALFSFLDIDWDETVLAPELANHDEIERRRIDDCGLWDGVGSIAPIFKTSVNRGHVDLKAEDYDYLMERIANFPPYIDYKYKSE
jgi:hypothetical protein